MPALDLMKTPRPKIMPQPYVVLPIMEMSLVAQSWGTDGSELVEAIERDVIIKVERLGALKHCVRSC